MKRSMALLLSATMVLTFGFSGCTSSNQAQPGGTASASSTSSETTGEPVTIVYGGYENQLMMNELASKFEETHPDINVEVYNNGQWLGNDQLTLLASSGNLPDIINLQDTVVPIENNWVIDLTPYYNNDQYKDNLPPDIVADGQIDNELVMLPSQMSILGYDVNTSLLQQNNISIPSYNWTFDDFKNISEKCTVTGKTMGCAAILDLLKFGPANMNPDLDCGAFNPTTQQYEFQNEWVQIADFATNLCQEGTVMAENLNEIGNPSDYTDGSSEQQQVKDQWSAEVMKEVGESDPYVAWLKGKVAINPSSTDSQFYNDPNYSGFQWDFFPYPVQNEGDTPRMALNVDSIGITTSCKNPEQAYEFVQFLTDDPAGFQAREDIVTNYDKDSLEQKYPDLDQTLFQNPLQITAMPVTVNQDEINQFVDFTKASDGIKYCMNQVAQGGAYVDGFKVTPGFQDAYINTVEKTANTQILNGQASAADLAPSLEDQANQITSNAFSARDAAIASNQNS